MKTKPISLPQGRDDLNCGRCEKGTSFSLLGRTYFLSPLPQILIPALMITAEKDLLLTPELSKHMEDWVRMVLP